MFEAKMGTKDVGMVERAQGREELNHFGGPGSVVPTLPAVHQAGWVQLGVSACFTLCLLRGITWSSGQRLVLMEPRAALLHHGVPFLPILQTARYVRLAPREQQLPQPALPS